MLNAAESAKHKVVLVIIIHSLYAIVLSLIKHYQKKQAFFTLQRKGMAFNLN